MRNWLLYIILLTLISSCLSQLDVDIEADQPTLVVEGFITNEIGVYTIKLSTLAALNGEGNNTLGIGALVMLQEIDGPSVIFNETLPGTYQLTPGEMVGEVGKSYQLIVRLLNGEEYVSSVETIQEPVSVLGGEAILVEHENVRNGISSRTFFHEIILDIENEERDHFYIVENVGWAEVEIGYGDCGFFGPSAAGPTICWSRRELGQSSLITGTNNGLNDNDYKIFAGAVGVDAKGRYVFAAKVHSMTSQNFKFLNSIESQLTQEGGLFDRPIAPIIGNIMNARTNRPALGYFHAYATTTEIVCFDRSEVAVSVTIPGPVPCTVLCTQVWPQATFTDIAEVFCQ